MPLDERRAPDARAAPRVAGRDVFRWASDVLDILEELPERRGVVPPVACLPRPPRRSAASIGERIECPRLTFGSQPKSFGARAPAAICSS